jgi:HD-GYP domain-containing protein (c-di-GMP phosphodiesterase class II)
LIGTTPQNGNRSFFAQVPGAPQSKSGIENKTMSKIAKESLLLLSLFLIAAMMQFFAQSLPMALCFYFLPTLYSAYYFGRRHATLTAFAGVFLVVLLDFLNNLIPQHRVLSLPDERLFNFAIWAGILVVVGYVMGTLYERKEAMTSDIRESFGGLLLMMQHFTDNDKTGVGESHRVAEISAKIALMMGLGSDRVELLRSAVLLIDLTKLGISNDILYKAADISRDDVVASFRKPRRADVRTQAAGHQLRRVIPIIVAQQIVLEQGARSINVPIEAHILVVADAYQKLISGVEGKPLLPPQAEQQIVAEAGQRFHPGVVEALTKALGQRERSVSAGV